MSAPGDVRLVAVGLRDGSGVHRHPASGPGTFAVGGLEVTIAPAPGAGDGAAWTWAVANDSGADAPIDAVFLEWEVDDFGSAPVLWTNGYQSWSATGARRLGHHEDPSRHPHSLEFVRSLHHADPRVTEPGELRSEIVTVLASDPEHPRSRPPLLVGFRGGDRHDGTIWASIADAIVTLRAEAHFGGAIVRQGTQRTLHDVELRDASQPAAALDAWAARFGAAAGARTNAPYQVGWCSWYHYFHEVTERALWHNLAQADDWPFDVFQLDDGYQAHIGDWTRTNDRFPSSIDAIAQRIHDAGRTPGLWTAPFLAHPESEVALRQPHLFARDTRNDSPMIGMWHEQWGGFMWELDTTSPDGQAHLERLGADLVAAGYQYLKLDFTFSPAIPGRFADPTLTPAERVRAGYAAIRRGAGPDTFILGCGCPLGAVVGLVDGMRIGPDVAPSWERDPNGMALAGYEEVAPSTRQAWVSTLARSFLHRRWWLNDPDCLMLRTTETDLTPTQARAWAYAVGVSGGMALVSDDLALLDDDARRLLHEVVTIGRAVDAASGTGPAPVCSDLLDPAGPTTLHGAGYELHAALVDPHATLTLPPTT